MRVLFFVTFTRQTVYRNRSHHGQNDVVGETEKFSNQISNAYPIIRFKIKAISKVYCR